MRPIAPAVFMTLLAAAALRAGTSTILFDEFDDLSGWSADWAAGPGYNLPRFEESLVLGFGSGYGAPTAAMTRRLNRRDLRSFRLETRATASGSGSSQIQFCLFASWETDWSGYILNLDGEDYIYPARVRLYRIDRHRPTILGSYDTFAVQRWESFKLERHADGRWRLFIGGFPVEDGWSQADTTYADFSHIGVMLDNSGDKIDYLRLTDLGTD